jgi:hypothetical protein
MIYFVQAEQGGLIKIGWTESYFRGRMLTLQRGSPVPLVCLAVIEDSDHSDERAMHERFREQRAYSEWFRPSPELLAVIEEATKTSGEWLGFRVTIKPKTGNWNPTAAYRRGEL